MGSRRWRFVAMVGMGLAAAACGAEAGRRAQTQPAKLSPNQPFAGGDDIQTSAASRPVVVVDVDRPWMKWGEPRPDSGRGRNRVDPTRHWTEAQVLRIKPPVTPTTAAATREAIPKPVEPGSRVQSGPVVPEPAEILGR